MVLRVPVVPGVNDGEENARETARFIAKELCGRVAQVQLLPYLKMGTEKYDSLGLAYPMGEDYHPPKKEEREPWLLHLAEVMREEGVNAVSGASTHYALPQK